MSGSGICFSYGDTEQAVVPTQRTRLGIPEDAVMYISGANMVKFGSSLCESWAAILSAVPESVLVLYPFNPNWLLQYPIAGFTRELHAVFAKCGVAKDRVIVLEPKDDFSHRRGVLELADVYLDGYPYSGATSVADALQAHLPTVALEGRYLRFRQAAAMLREMQLHDLVAVSEEDYRKIAIELGRNKTLRDKFRVRIQENLGMKNNFLDSRGYSEKVANILDTLFNQGT
jgi:predicted O-linked N-acetylglucosamine transferase (SPINDLY family)